MFKFGDENENELRNCRACGGMFNINFQVFLTVPAKHVSVNTNCFQNDKYVPLFKEICMECLAKGIDNLIIEYARK
jgi:hypothetical protein